MKIELELEPFTVPNFVRVKLPPGNRQDGFHTDGGSFPLSQIDAGSLGQLCDQFRAQVFEKAGKQDPRDYDHNT